MTKDSLMYQLREAVCLIYSASQVRLYYFRQMERKSIETWWKSWDKYHKKLCEIRENMPESAAMLPKTMGKEGTIHEEANLKVYKISGQIVEWYKADENLRHNQELEEHKYAFNGSPTELWYKHRDELYTSMDALEDIFKNGLDDIVGDPTPRKQADCTRIKGTYGRCGCRYCTYNNL